MGSRCGTGSVVVAALAVACGCGRTELSAPSPPAPPGGQPPSVAGGGEGGAGGFGGVGGSVVPEGGSAASSTSGTGGQVVVPAVALAHTKDALYEIAENGEAALVGSLEGCHGDVTDIAWSAEDELFAVTVGALYRVSVAPSPLCEKVFEGAMPNSLTFLPPGVLGIDEVLVGYRERTYVRLDPVTKTEGAVGDLGVPGFVSSGDLVWYAERLFLSVSGEGCDDCLVQVDPTTGLFQATTGDLPVGSLFGLAAIDEGVLGFLGSGHVVLLDPFTSSVEPLGDLPLPWLGGTAL